jgi:hypothetical protein
MGLSDFERDLAEEKSTRDSKRRSRDEDGERKHRHHHRSHKHGDRDEQERRRRHKRHRDREDDEDRHKRKRRRSSPAEPAKKTDDVAVERVKVFDSDNDDEEDEWVEKETLTAPPEEDILDQRDVNLGEAKIQRDAWMQQPSSLDIEVVASKKPKARQSQFVGAKGSHEFKVHEGQVNQHLKDLEADFADSDNEAPVTKNAVKDEPAQHEVNYTFGDAGSAWRMTKLRAVYRIAEERGHGVDEVAMEKYGDLQLFDDAREEEREMERRRMYGDEYVGKEKPSGELFQERKLNAGIHRTKQDSASLEKNDLPQCAVMTADQQASAPSTTVPLDATALNKLKAQMMKAKLRNAPNAAQLEEEYRLAESASLANSKQPDVVVLNNMENRLLASGREGEVTSLTGKRARERGLVKENEDMSIEDMVRQERRTARGAGGSSGRELAERIAKDGKFVDDLDYMDDNAEKLSKKVVKTDSQLRNSAIEDYSRMRKVLDKCPLCHHEDAPNPSDQLPVAPIISLATRTYLTLPTEPEIVNPSKSGASGAVIVPIQHRTNLLECDEDEWEEVRNFMKSLTRFYDAAGKGVLFYENAAHAQSRRGHAALHAVPLPHHLVETAPAYFKEAILAADAEWSQHKPIIDTLALSQRAGYGKLAFRRSMVSEMPYFHVWFTLDGGMGHVVEDERRWPKGDLFAREVLGGMVDAGPERVKKQGRWERGDRRVEGFRRGWRRWDWTRALVDAEGM